MRLDRKAMVAAIGLMAMSLTGCAGKFTGGGKIPSALAPNAISTFGFNLKAQDADGDGFADTFKGQLEYQDHGGSVRIHGVVLQGTAIPPDVLGVGGAGVFTGTYKAQGGGAGGTFLVLVADIPELGGDVFAIQLIDGVYNGYNDLGLVTGGNIQYHP